MKISLTDTDVYVDLLKLVRDIYQHQNCNPALRTYVKLRLKQLYRGDLDFDGFLRGRE